MILSVDGPMDAMSACCLPFINVFDYAGQPMARIWSIDTETMKCAYKHPFDTAYGAIKAAGFCFVAGTKEQQDKMLATLPPELQCHIVVIPDNLWTETEAIARKAFAYQWITNYLANHNAK